MMQRYNYRRPSYILTKDTPADWIRTAKLNKRVVRFNRVVAVVERSLLSQVQGELAYFENLKLGRVVPAKQCAWIARRPRVGNGRRGQRGKGRIVRNRGQQHNRGQRGSNPKLRALGVGGPFAVPARIRAKLTFSKTVAITNTGFGYANIRFSPTNAYDVDPAFASTAMPFFTEYTTMYRRYRVDSSAISVKFANLDLIAHTAYVTADNQDPGANLATPQPLMSNRTSRHGVLGLGTGQGTCSIRNHASTSIFAGVANVGQDDAYSALSGNSPTNNWWWAVGVFSTGSIANGVHVDVRMDVTVEFYEVGTPST